MAAYFDNSAVYFKTFWQPCLLQYIYVLAGLGGYFHWLVYDLQYHQPDSTTVPVVKQ